MEVESCPLSIPESAERVEVKEEPLVVCPGGCSIPVMGGQLPVGDCSVTGFLDGGEAPLEEIVLGDLFIAEKSQPLVEEGSRVIFWGCSCPN